jgi:hypothetical protein
MDSAILHRRRLAVFTLAVAALALAAVAKWPPKTASADLPIRVDRSSVDEGYCDFPVLSE